MTAIYIEHKGKTYHRFFRKVITHCMIITVLGYTVQGDEGNRAISLFKRLVCRWIETLNGGAVNASLMPIWV